jgi:hypothetical protein
MLATFHPLTAVFLAHAGLSDMIGEQWRAQFVRLVIASALLPWGWLFLRSSIVLGILGILQAVIVGYCSFRAFRFFRPRIESLALCVLATVLIYSLLCVTTNALGAAIVLKAPHLLHSLAR